MGATSHNVFRTSWENVNHVFAGNYWPQVSYQVW